jgi:fatty acid desaturase
MESAVINSSQAQAENNPLSTEPAVKRELVDDAEMKRIVRDLHKANPRIFWTDLLLTCAAGWGAFTGAVLLRPFSPAMLGCIAVAVCSLYRALCFMHEISHQSDRSLPGFESTWNWLVGFPLLMPSFVYCGVHQSHHRLSTYGTSQDPEYMPFAQSHVMTTVFALESFFIPFALLFRFLVLTPVGLISTRFQRALVVYGSALTMNVKYRREATPQLTARIRMHSAMVFGLWVFALGLAASHILPWRVFLVWLAVDSLISFVNTLRTLGAHGYESDGHQLDRQGQLLDSIDTPGAFWTELWAPVGLRYHALHHYFPGIPYHNLRRAYRRIMRTASVAPEYGQMTSPSLPHSLQELVRKGLESSRR